MTVAQSVSHFPKPPFKGPVTKAKLAAGPKSSTKTHGLHDPQGPQSAPLEWSGLERFQACGASARARTCAQEIGDLVPYLDLAVQDAVQLGLERLAWMIDREVRGVDDRTVVEAELEALKQDLLSGNNPSDRLAHWDKLMQGYVYNKLRYQSESADNTPEDVYAQQWNRTFAGLLVGPGDRCVATALPIVEQLMELGNWDWLPTDHREDRVGRLKQLFRNPSLLTHIDELAQTQPIHERAQHLLNLGCERYRNPNYMLLIEVVNAWFTPALQDDIGNCWFVAPNRAHQANEPHLLLDCWREFLESGTLPFKKNRDGDVMHVVPDPYPEQAMKWASRAYDKWSGAADGFVSEVPKLVEALKRALPQPQRTNDAWKAKIKEQFIQLQAQAPGGRVRVRDVLDRVLADCLDVPPFLLGNARVLMGDKLSVQPNDKWQLWKERLEAHERLVGDVLFAVETRNFSSLAHVWQSTYSNVVVAQRLARQWLKMEKALRAALSKPKPLPGMDEHLRRMRKMFFQGATLRLDLSDEFPGQVMFRIFAKVPGAQGRGMPIRNSTDLITWLDHYSALAGQATMEDGPSQTRQRLERVKAVLCSGQFQATLGGKGKPAKPLWLAKVRMGRKDHRGDFLAVPNLDGKRKDGFVTRVFGIHARNELFVGPRTYRVEAALDIRIFLGWRSHEKCLAGLINQVRSFSKKHQPEDLRQHMKAKEFLTYDSLDPDLNEQSHVANVRMQDPGFRALWASGLSAGGAIDRHLKKPMKEQLRVELDPQQAHSWVDRVLRQCQLTEGADRQAAADEVLQRARRHNKRSAQDPLSLKSLVWALGDLRSDRSNSDFADRKAARGELVVAVLNEMPEGAPMAIPGHNNYRDPRRCYEAYVADPFRPGRIVHVEGQYLPVGKDRHRFRTAKLSPSRIF